MPRWEIRRAYNWNFAKTIPDRKVEIARRDQEQFDRFMGEDWEPFSACPDLAENAEFCTIVWFKRQVVDA